MRYKIINIENIIKYNIINIENVVIHGVVHDIFNIKVSGMLRTTPYNTKGMDAHRIWNACCFQALRRWSVPWP